MVLVFFFFLIFSLIENFKMSDRFETYSSAEFRIQFLNDETGKLIKSDNLFDNLYDFWVCLRAPGFMKTFVWYHSKVTKLGKIMGKKWEKTKDLHLVNVVLRKLKEGDNSFNPKQYLGEDEEKYFQVLQQ